MRTGQLRKLLLLERHSQRDWNDYLFNSSSDYHEDIRALGKRLFTYVAGSQNSNDYRSGKKGSEPTREQVDAYIPAVYDGVESAYYGNWLATSAARGTLTYYIQIYIIFSAVVTRFVFLNGVVANRVLDERAYSQQVKFGNKPFQILSPLMHGCTAVSQASIKFLDSLTHIDWPRLF